VKQASDARIIAGQIMVFHLPAKGSLSVRSAFDVCEIINYIYFIHPLAVHLASVLDSGLAIMSEVDPWGFFVSAG
jgi:hypothetical protein